MYLDLLLFISTAVHYSLLRLTAKLFHRQASWWRLLTGAALGAPAVLLLALPGARGLVVAAIIAAPLVMLIAAFWPLRLPELLYYWGAFFLAAFAVAGAAAALLNSPPLRHYFATSGGVLLLLGVCCGVECLCTLLRPLSEEKKWQKLWRGELEIAWRGKEKVVPAFVDTGNRLRDPFSGLPVIVVDYRSLEEILPPAIYRHLADERLEPWGALEKLTDPALARCFTVIPCRGVGREREILLGLKPDCVILYEEGRSFRLGSRVYLGLSRRGFGPTADYRALLPPGLLRAG